MSFQSAQIRYGNDDAAVDLSDKQFHLIKITASGWDVSGAGERVDGVNQDKVDQGKAVQACMMGVTKVVLGGTAAKGDKVESDADGKAVIHAAGEVAGILLESGEAGDIVAMSFLSSYNA